MGVVMRWGFFRTGVRLHNEVGSTLWMVSTLYLHLYLREEDYR